MVPKTMEQEEFYQEIVNYSSIEEYAIKNGRNVDQVMQQFNDLRMDHDFELYAATTITIQDKETKKKFKLKCRRSQRKILKELERMRVAGEPIRAILLKARQLGGSTLIQCYFFWIQDRLKENWHSAIFADVEDQAKNIRGMYTTISDHHPVNQVTLKPFEQSNKVRIYKERGNIIGVGSMQKPDSIRGYDYAMVHCSEVGLWKKTEGKSPKDLVQSVRAALADVPYSCEILESTAKGVGNFFHKEWTAAKRKESGYSAIFVAWWEIELYWKKVEGDLEEFIKTWNSYEKWLWNIGASIEGIYWYRYYKKAKQYDEWRMKSEFPSCIAAGVKVGSDKGIIPIEECFNSTKTNMGDVIGFHRKGKKEVFKLVTKYGYELYCTEDHRIQTAGGEWKELKDLAVGDDLKLSIPRTAEETFYLKWNRCKSINCSLEITPEMGRFIGIFMGDGSYSGQVLSIACDARDEDFIEDTRKLVYDLFGVELTPRLIGKNKGCLELRAQKKDLTSLFLRLGLIEKKPHYKRKICVPKCILQSPKTVIREFLRGIFETDGFNNYQVPKIGLFSKYEDFLKDIQLLLLSFGITSKYKERNTINGNGYEYAARTLHLMGEQADLYKEHIGFLSKRKDSRFDGWLIKNNNKRTKNVLSDSIEKIEYSGIKETYDLSIKDSHCFDAGGILVHNCDIEAFQSTGRRYFKPEIVERARRSNRAPDFIGDLFADAFTGPEAIENISFSEVPEGNLSVWLMPETFTDKEVLNRYVVSLDIGGRSDTSDNSVIKVIDRYWMLEGGIPEVAAVWEGHLDFDKLAWKAIQLCIWYNNAFYIPEINKMSEKHEDTEGINFITILDEIVDYYDNIYTRSSPEQVRAGAPVAYGFHTNKTTKPRILNALNKAWRDDAYYEYDERACDEGDQFEVKENGSFGAVDGAHDDHVIATALAVWAALDEMPPVEIVPIKKQGTKKPKHKSFSTI